MHSSKSASLTSASSPVSLEGSETSSAFKFWVEAARPKTLGASWVPVIAASALAHALDLGPHGWVLACALISSLFIQIATNLFNDVIDFSKGADTEARLGPRRVTAQGIFNRSQVLRAAVGCALVAMLFGVPLVLHGGLPIVAIGVVSLFLAYGYTGGPFPLAYLGLGDLFVYLFFGIIAVGGTFYLQSGGFDHAVPAFVLGSQIGLWATALIAINNGRDRAEDSQTGKRTLAVRLGLAFTRAEITACLALPLLVGAAYWGARGLWAMAVLPLLVSPLVVKTALQVWRNEPSREWNGFLAKAGAVHLLGGLLLGLGAYFGSK